MTNDSFQIVILSKDSTLKNKLLDRFREANINIYEVKCLFDAEEVHEEAKIVFNKLWLLDLRKPDDNSEKWLKLLTANAAESFDKPPGPLFILLKQPSDKNLLNYFLNDYPAFGGVVFEEMFESGNELSVAERFKENIDNYFSTCKKNEDVKKSKIIEIPNVEGDDEQLRFVTLCWGRMAEFMNELRRKVKLMRNTYVEKVIVNSKHQELLKKIFNPDGKKPSWTIRDKFKTVTVSQIKNYKDDEHIVIPEIPENFKPNHLLFTGETGTGKTLLAGILKKVLKLPETAPIITVNASGLSETMLEYQLFGHMRGIATDIDIGRPGYVLSALGGILFFDEIGDIPLKLQPRLLTFLDNLQITPAGFSDMTPKLPVYIVAATNRDLEKDVRDGKFRADLYYRFLLKIRIPSISERREDIPQLALFALRNPTINVTLRSGECGFPNMLKIEKVTSAFLEKLKSLELPGNFRQLQDILGQAVLAAAEDFCDTLDVCHLPSDKIRSQQNLSNKNTIFETYKQSCSSSDNVEQLFESNSSLVTNKSKKRNSNKTAVKTKNENVSKVLSERIWKKVANILPPVLDSGPNKTDEQKIFQGILWKFQNQVGWKKIPSKIASGITCWRRFNFWKKKKVWKEIRETFLQAIGEQERVMWESCLPK